MGAYQRRKGHDWEREVARRFREAMPGCEAKRGLSQSRGGTKEGGDVALACFTVECKVGARPNVLAAVDQAAEHEEPGKWPIAVVKRDREAPVVAMRLEDFLELAGAWWRETGGTKAEVA